MTAEEFFMKYNLYLERCKYYITKECASMSQGGGSRMDTWLIGELEAKMRFDLVEKMTNLNTII
jgi:hypothetical protein